MARCSHLSSDSEIENNEEILKLFVSEDEVDASFSGFSSQALERADVPVFDS